MFGGIFGRQQGKSGAEARRWVAEGALLLDVRTPAEHAQGHIEGSLNIPVQELGARMAELPRGRSVVVYCRSGGRSAAATSMLQTAGHPVLDLGPMHAW